MTLNILLSAIHTANFVKNRLLHTRIEKSPHEEFWGHKPKIDWLRAYGSKCWVLIPKHIRKKGDFRSVEGIFIGYYDDSKAYKIWIPRIQQIMKARDVIFDESNHIERVTIHATDDDDLPNLWERDIPIHITPIEPPTPQTQWTADEELPFPPEKEPTMPVDEEPRAAVNEEPRIITEGETDDQGTEGQLYAPKDFERGVWLDPSNITYGKGQRSKVPRKEHSDMSAHTNLAHEITDHIFMTLIEDEPPNFRSAMKSPDCKKWMEACQKEYDTLMDFNTWTLVEKPPGINVVGNRWVFRIKRDNVGQVDRIKARLVAQGFSQVPGIDFNETYSPTIRFTSIRFILALAAHYNLELRQIDIKGAYLNGMLDETVYMRQPEGFTSEGRENYVCKLNKGIYGLKQSGRVWYQTLKDKMKKLGFIPGKADGTIFFRHGENGELEVAGWYVDDGLLAANSILSMNRMVNDIKKVFEIQDLGSRVDF